MTIPTELATALLGGGGLSAILTYLSGRHHGRADFINAVAAAADKVIARLQDECERVSARCEALEAQDEQCRRDLAEVRDEIARLKEAGLKIDALMQGPVAAYRIGPAE